MPEKCPAPAHERLASMAFELALDHYPALLNIEEIVRELADDPVDFEGSEDIRDAIRDLVKEGLLHRVGHFVFASRTAVRAAELCI